MADDTLVEERFEIEKLLFFLFARLAHRNAGLLLEKILDDRAFDHREVRMLLPIDEHLLGEVDRALWKRQFPIVALCAIDDRVERLDGEDRSAALHPLEGIDEDADCVFFRWLGHGDRLEVFERRDLALPEGMVGFARHESDDPAGRQRQIVVQDIADSHVALGIEKTLDALDGHNDVAGIDRFIEECAQLTFGINPLSPGVRNRLPHVKNNEPRFIDDFVCETVLADATGKCMDNGTFADAWIADEKRRIVCRTREGQREHLHHFFPADRLLAHVIAEIVLRKIAHIMIEMRRIGIGPVFADPGRATEMIPLPEAALALQLEEMFAFDLPSSVKMLG